MTAPVDQVSLRTPRSLPNWSILSHLRRTVCGGSLGTHRRGCRWSPPKWIQVGSIKSASTAVTGIGQGCANAGIRGRFDEPKPGHPRQPTSRTRKPSWNASVQGVGGIRQNSTDESVCRIRVKISARPATTPTTGARIRWCLAAESIAAFTSSPCARKRTALVNALGSELVWAHRKGAQ